MNSIQPKSITLSVSRIHPLGWWLGNGDEHVAKGTALGLDCTETIYEPSGPGLIGKYVQEMNTWSEVEDKSAYEFWSPQGELHVIGVPDGDYPDWAVKQKPPVFNREKQTVFYDNDVWVLFDIEINKPYWDSETNKFIVSDYNFTLPENYSFIEPLEASKGFAVRLVNSAWKQIEDHRKRVIYDCSDCTNAQEVEELGAIKDGFTFDEPNTLFDEWIGGVWVTNQSNKHIADVNQVDDARRALYLQMCDPLISEANIKRLQGHKQEAIDMEAQALAARAKIQQESPWPKAS